MNRVHWSNVHDVYFSGRQETRGSNAQHETPLSKDSIVRELSVESVAVIVFYSLKNINGKVTFYFLQYSDKKAPGDIKCIGGKLLPCELPLRAARRYLYQQSANAIEIDEKTLNDHAVFRDHNKCRYYILHATFDESTKGPVERSNDSFKFRPKQEFEVYAKRHFSFAEDDYVMATQMSRCVIKSKPDCDSGSRFILTRPYPKSTYPQLSAAQEYFVCSCWKKKDKTILITKFSVQIMAENVKNFKGPAWLMSHEIKFYCDMIQEMSDVNKANVQLPTIWITDPATYDNITPNRMDAGGTLSKDRDGRWRTAAHNADLLIFPINLNGDHWICGCIDFREASSPKIFLYDSLYGLAKMPSVTEPMKLKFATYAKLVRRKLAHNVQCTVVDCPKQKNFYDCGVFTMQCILHLALGRNPQGDFAYAQEDIPILRRRMAYEILTNTLLPVPDAVEKEKDGAIKDFFIIDFDTIVALTKGEKLLSKMEKGGEYTLRKAFLTWAKETKNKFRFAIYTTASQDNISEILSNISSAQADAVKDALFMVPIIYGDASLKKYGKLLALYYFALFCKGVKTIGEITVFSKHKEICNLWLDLGGKVIEQNTTAFSREGKLNGISQVGFRDHELWAKISSEDKAWIKSIDQIDYLQKDDSGCVQKALNDEIGLDATLQYRAIQTMTEQGISVDLKETTFADFLVLMAKNKSNPVFSTTQLYTESLKILYDYALNNIEGYANVDAEMLKSFSETRKKKNLKKLLLNTQLKNQLLKSGESQLKVRRIHLILKYCFLLQSFMMTTLLESF